MTLEECAKRMTVLLRAKPRQPKSRSYVNSLSKRPAIVVSPLDYSLTNLTKSEARSLGLSDERDAARYAAWEAGGKKPICSIMPARKRQRYLAHKSLLFRIAKAQAMRCAACGEQLEFGGSHDDPLRATFDHVLPRVLGGKDRNNRVAMHRTCNLRKGARSPRGCEIVMLMAVNAVLAEGVTLG
jgi:hypothetical protein